MTVSGELPSTWSKGKGRGGGEIAKAKCLEKKSDVGDWINLPSRSQKVVGLSGDRAPAGRGCVGRTGCPPSPGEGTGWAEIRPAGRRAPVISPLSTRGSCKFKSNLLTRSRL